MNNTKEVAANKNFTAVDLGKFALLSETANGKAFLKEMTNATGTEISLSVFHTHKQNEETYIILSGAGKFQVDDQCFDIAEGSVVRVGPAGVRGMTNTSDKEMIYIVVQSKEGSLEQYSMGDGELLEATPLWK